MAEDSQYPRIARTFNPEHFGCKRMKHWSEETNWQPLSAAVDVLKRKVEAAYYRCDEAEADAAHDDLVSAEWRLRQAERRRDRG